MEPKEPNAIRFYVHAGFVFYDLQCFREGKLVIDGGASEQCACGVDIEETGIARPAEDMLECGNCGTTYDGKEVTRG